MRVSCKSCGAAVPAANLNLDRMVAKCGACHAVFAFAVDGAAPPTSASTADTLSSVLGWTYFAAWSIRFYLALALTLPLTSAPPSS